MGGTTPQGQGCWNFTTTKAAAAQQGQPHPTEHTDNHTDPSHPSCSCSLSGGGSLLAGMTQRVVNAIKNSTDALRGTQLPQKSDDSDTRKHERPSATTRLLPAGHRNRYKLTQVTTAKWVNSTEGIHAWLPFDGEANPADISEFAPCIDFVWGSNTARVPAWRAANPSAILAKYIPYTRDPACPQMSGKDEPRCRNKTAGFQSGCPTCMPWWKEHRE